MAQSPVASLTLDETIAAIIDDGYLAGDRPAIVGYLRGNADLLPVLTRIRKRMPPSLQAPRPLLLELVFDPEWEDDPPRLFVRIPTTLEADVAVDALDRIRDAWWIEDVRRFGDRLGLLLDFV